LRGIILLAACLAGLLVLALSSVLALHDCRGLDRCAPLMWGVALRWVALAGGVAGVVGLFARRTGAVLLLLAGLAAIGCYAAYWVVWAQASGTPPALGRVTLLLLGLPAYALTAAGVLAMLLAPQEAAALPSNRTFGPDHSG
jgi:hypothetical protein